MYTVWAIYVAKLILADFQEEAYPDEVGPENKLGFAADDAKVVQVAVEGVAEPV